ncbi:PPOX class F420-dependent oxidoreductase [Actinomadura logoneensis]|uniref:PPOX class F420-dependent oxidoreductase n=1 Tax=Actinomadura logoneensis TaxID=2293572 RepID=A0A372JEB3_9ACTN|nr:PPOX class F420-dependent oxidoreductase [Actinomadura logoneensis]RFU38156.1 PPOX class F420-dependent oxidoreductase [Actinomadura logoneensis]
MADEAGEARLRELLARRRLGALVTLKKDGRPQLSNIIYGYDADRDLVRISVTDDRAKTRNLRRDPRASLHVSSEDGWSWVVAEGTAELSDVAAEERDATVEELVDLYRALQGEHPDWDDFRRAMVGERRLVVRLPVEHLYGQPPR